MDEAGEGNWKPSGTVGEHTKKMPEFGSKEYDRKPSKIKKIAQSALAAIGIGAAATYTTGNTSEAIDAIHDAPSSSINTLEDITNIIKVPADKGIDLMGKIIPDDEPDEPRIPNKILLGQVEIKVTDDLNLRSSPHTTGKADKPNKIDWKNANLANKIVIEGQEQLVPLEKYEEGSTLVVKNPEIVIGQHTGGGNGIGENSYWIQLYRIDGSPVFVNFQSETRDFVKEIKDNPSEPSKFINAKTLQDSGGVKVVVYDQTPPENTSQITIKKD